MTKNSILKCRLSADLNKTREAERSFPGKIGDFLFFSGTFTQFVARALLTESFIYKVVRCRVSVIMVVQTYLNNEILLELIVCFCYYFFAGTIHAKILVPRHKMFYAGLLLLMSKFRVLPKTCLMFFQQMSITQGTLPKNRPQTWAFGST